MDDNDHKSININTEQDMLAYLYFFIFIKFLIEMN